MGLESGEKIERLGMIRVTDVRREPFNRTCADLAYGWRECALEGFEGLEPTDFVLFFCDSHKGCRPGSVVTRIEFEYLE